MTTSNLKRQTAVRRTSATATCCIALGLVVLAVTVAWGWNQWEQLVERGDRAEALLLLTRKELVAHQRRSKELQAVEAALRREMTQLDQLVGQQVEPDLGVGVSRQMIIDAFDHLTLVNKDADAGHRSEHYALEGCGSSIQLRGSQPELNRIEFFGNLEGDEGEASAAMLVTLLSAAAPEWTATEWTVWLDKLVKIDDGVVVCKEIDRQRVAWYWTRFEGVRVDVLSIEPR